MEKKTLTVRQLFRGMPYLRHYFENLDKEIAEYLSAEGESERVKKLKKKRNDLLSVAQNLNAKDLHTLYYLQYVMEISTQEFSEPLQKLYEAETELRAFMKKKMIKE